MHQKAISATVNGDDQQVGFRAMIMKQAIEYNLSGSARNEANEIVHFTLQGDSDRLGQALAAVRDGTKKSSDIEVSATKTAVDPRNITTRYTLVFTLRAHDKAISKSDAKDVWHQILQATLHGDDLKKLGKDD